MADDLIITIGANVKGVATAINTTKSLEGRVVKLQKAIDEGRISNSQFDMALQKLAKSSKSYEKSVLDYSKALQVANKAQKEAAAAAKQAKEEDRAFAQARREAIALNKEFNEQKKREAAETARAAAEQERLNRKFVEGHAAMEIYSRELNDLAMALEAKIITDVQQKAAVAKLNQEMAAGTGVFSTFGRGVNQTKGYTNQFGLVTQQVGYQVGDLAVQVQSGTNFFVAFGQQMTQLAGLGAQLSKSMAMIGVFTGLGIAIPIITGILAYMTRTKEETQKTVDAFQKLAEVTKELGLERRKALDPSFDENLVGTKDRLKELTESYQSAKKVVEDFAEASRVASQSGVASGGMGQALGYEAMGQAFVQLANLDFDFNKEQTAALALIEAEKELVRYKGERADAQARAAQESVSELNAQIELNEVILKYGRDSLLVKEKQAVLDKRAFIDEQLKAGITGKELSKVLAVYDTNVKLTKEIEATVVAAEMLGDTDMSQGFKNALTVAQQLALATRNILFPTVPERGDPRSFENDPYWQDRAFPKPYVPTAPSGGGGGGGGSAPSDPLADLMKRIELEKELLGTSEEYQEVMQAIQDSDKKYSDAAIQGAVARLEAINKEKEALQQMESLQQSIAETIGDGFMSMVDGTKTVKEAFRDMARDIIKQLYEVLVIQRLVNGVKTILGGSGLFADGGAFSAGRQIQAYANGGVVGGPTYFPMSGGKTGLMGEAGPEAIMPLKRGKGGKLGVSVEGSSGSVNVVNNINVTGGSDPAAIRAEVAKLMPQITSATKSAVIDARRRGGQMKAAFN
jgi:hypothetical protein